MLVISWNILSDIWINKNSNYKTIDEKYLYFNHRKNRVKYILKKLNPDIILLQEIDTISYPFIKKIFGKKYWISSLNNINWCDEDMKNKCESSGNVVLIKSKFIEKKPIEQNLNISAKRNCLIVKFNDFIIANVHLSSQEQNLRTIEMTNLLKYLKKENEKIIIGGDFNTNIRKTNSIHKMLIDNGFQHTFDENKHPTFILEKPVLIDFIYYKNMRNPHIDFQSLFSNNFKNQQQLENNVFKLIGSDHLPVIVCF